MKNSEFVLHPDRYFDSDPDIRKSAIEIYHEIKDLPIISPHGHVDPSIFVKNEPFSNPTELLLTPDHYLLRMLYSTGIPLESLGIPTVEGRRTENDPRKIWKIFAQNYYLFAGTPSGVWLDYEFNIVFGITKRLNGKNASEIYGELNEKIKSPEFFPRALYERFNIEVLTTTDAATDSLSEHLKIKDSGWNGRIIPCFRPDGLTDISDNNWKKNIEVLGNLFGKEVDSYKEFLRAIEERRQFFKSLGATSTDHGVFSPYTTELSDQEAERIFQKALKNHSETEDAKLFTAHMLMEMAKMSIEDGLVMQIHPGSFRNHDSLIYEKYGPDKGCDIPVRTEFSNNLKCLLNKYGNNPNLTLIIFTLDESVYSRELAPLAGHYPAMKLGSAWWFHDSIEGMTRYRQMVTETAGFYNTAGFNDDTRAFVSIPARHDLSRRVDSNYLAGLVAKHILDLDDAKHIGKSLAYDLVKQTYKL